MSSHDMSRDYNLQPLRGTFKIYLASYRDEGAETSHQLRFASNRDAHRHVLRDIAQSKGTLAIAGSVSPRGVGWRRARNRFVRSVGAGGRGGIGRRKGLKIPRGQPRPGSIPGVRTTNIGWAGAPAPAASRAATVVNR